MSIQRSAACVLATLLAVGAALASAGTADDDQPGEEQCLNVAVDHLASELSIFVTLFGQVGVGVASPEPNDGLTVYVYVVPELCEVGVSPVTTMLSENPIFTPEGGFPLAP